MRKISLFVAEMYELYSFLILSELLLCNDIKVSEYIVEYERLRQCVITSEVDLTERDKKMKSLYYVCKGIYYSDKDYELAVKSFEKANETILESGIHEMLERLRDKTSNYHLTIGDKSRIISFNWEQLDYF